ncbi:beta-ketoacyl synthase N-terminal-like domain-containing protein [Patiriisocius hiemis]|uniref:Beta-ketoacyl synthase N-terminal-like domain-containing protein n=1 Tax=Patiriisocius hiemis TaxID=3075604 RepID=A0ABU2YHB2_9FLAO|nr:beta-ketoacyl synthase N-terminal-like domain-containing protein [Constantimarinum sp. W242]MDT0556453.1 beta-ketoacyl synthase N-terminal-like domain-containing protein [Constantimarinum sp. W242]
MKQKISIVAIQSISALGSSSKTIWESYCSETSFFSEKEFNGETVPVSTIISETEKEIISLKNSSSKYKNLDRSVLLAMLASKKVTDGYILKNKHIGINIGSSRGATSLFEKHHYDFIKTKKVSAYTSPTTTLGNISSWVGQELEVEGVQIDHSVTCSTAMHALLNGIAWLQADMSDAFLVGGSEAALTPFTIAQMQALKLYSKSKSAFPCESLNFNKANNTMVLGEAAVVALLEKGVSEKSLATIVGYGFASEKIKHNSDISENAECFQKSMKMALQQANLETIDVIVMHAPGTVKGDQAEKNAIDITFGRKTPRLTTNKTLVGHTFAASGMLSIEMAILMLRKQKFIQNPFFYYTEKELSKPIKSILVNAVGFGGNAVSIILEIPEN